jgi:hypothetical protein
MATIDAKDLLERVSIVLNDDGRVRWTEAELIDWLNDAQRQLVLTRPDANVKNISVQLVAGVKQTLPTDGVKLVDVSRNMGSNGTTAGLAIRIVFKHLMDAQQPNWYTATAKGVVEHYMYDLRDPKTFYVYPAQPAAPEYIELVYAAYPTTITNVNVGTKISVDDIFANPLMDFVLFRAFSKDADAGNASLAAAYYESFIKTLSLKFEVDKLVDPNARLAS